MGDIIDPPPEAHGHHHTTGHRWLDLTLGISAIVISCISALLAFQHGAAMDQMVQQNARLVQASTWPYVSVFYSTGDYEGNHLYKLSVVNNGVGPARIGGVAFLYKGRPIKDAHALASQVAKDHGHDERAPVVASDLKGVLPARETINLLAAQPPFSPPWTIEALQDANEHGELDAQVCYCSILNECWNTSLRSSAPTPVPRCS